MKRLLLCGLILLGALACRPRLLWWRQQPDSYQALVSRWTRSGQLYQGLKTILVVSATYPHSSIRRAHVRRYAADHHLTPEQADKLLAEEREKARRQLQFIVTTFSDEEDWWRLEGDSCIWTINLVTADGKRIKPGKIEFLKQVPIYIRTYYPVFSPWKKVYRLSFPARLGGKALVSEQDGRIGLEFLSAMGQITLRWNFGDEAAGATR